MTREECYMQGMECFIEDRYEEAITWYEKALAHDPDYTDALLALGETYARLKRYDEAIEAAQRAAAADPNEVMAQTSLSRFYMEKGMIEEAEAAGAKARMLGWKAELREKSKKAGA
ncbi:MAG: tetratricopeptide repeat protein [Deltaproteobacteria bacterium]|nr:MAG: tetratricopeptide repeat protein [Deltaproteobacteria bacterium]